MAQISRDPTSGGNLRVWLVNPATRDRTTCNTASGDRRRLCAACLIWANPRRAFQNSSGRLTASSSPSSGRSFVTTAWVAAPTVDATSPATSWTMPRSLPFDDGLSVRRSLKSPPYLRCTMYP